MMSEATLSSPLEKVFVEAMVESRVKGLHAVCRHRLPSGNGAGGL